MMILAKDSIFRNILLKVLSWYRLTKSIKYLDVRSYCQSLSTSADRHYPQCPQGKFLFAFPLQKACSCYYTCWCSVSLTSHLMYNQVLFFNRQSGVLPTKLGSFVMYYPIYQQANWGKRGQSRDFSNVNVSWKLLLKLRHVIQNASCLKMLAVFLRKQIVFCKYFSESLCDSFEWSCCMHIFVAKYCCKQ